MENEKTIATVETDDDLDDDDDEIEEPDDPSVINVHFNDQKYTFTKDIDTADIVWGFSDLPEKYRVATTDEQKMKQQSVIIMKIMAGLSITPKISLNDLLHNPALYSMVAQQLMPAITPLLNFSQ
jgi:hypothetical protein